MSELKGDYFFGCSDCPWRTEDVKLDGKDEFHPLLPYCDLKMRFIGKNERAIKYNESCKDAIETANDDLGGVSVIGEDSEGNPITMLNAKEPIKKA